MCLCVTQLLGIEMYLKCGRISPPITKPWCQRGGKQDFGFAESFVVAPKKLHPVFSGFVLIEVLTSLPSVYKLEQTTDVTERHRTIDQDTSGHSGELA